jgi:filamentous hemagglutinin family protein
MPFARALRGLLLAGTALVPLAALAQAPDARPDLGRVVVGGITIEQDAARTAITQTQRRGIVEWRRFDVGRDHTVEFRQPDSRAVTLNRVEARDPSLVAGRITANGQVVIVNRSGVVFQQGAQVDAAGLVVTTADIADEAFLAGRMAFDRPGEPHARVENHGRITVREAGLAALVAPRVVNSGVITARLGRVVLAGAEAHTVDLHGDGLFEIEITRPVTVAPAGGGPVVDNTGTILADGGRVRLTAAAADGIVQDLVRAGGRIGADTDAATGRTGEVVIAGTGGAVRVQGEVSARGTAPGTRGGVIEVLGNRVLAEPGAVVDASGRAGGGEIAFGITRQGAAERRLAERTGVAPGARLNASATGQGDGGTIVVHSTQYTAVAGEIAARGGPEGGNGGFVEVSGERGLVLTRAPDVSAPAGAPGTVLVDPEDLTIVAAGDPRINVGFPEIGDGVLGEGEGPPQAFIGADVVGGFVGALRLEASRDITVEAEMQAGTSLGTLTLAAGRDVAVNAGLLDVPEIRLLAGRDILVNAALRTGNNEAVEQVLLTAGRGIRLAADIRTGRLSLEAGPGGILQTAGVLRADDLRVLSGGDALLPSANEVGLLFGFNVAGDFRLDTADNLLVPQQTSQARSITLRSAGTMQFFSEALLTATGIGEAGRITLQAPQILAPTGVFALIAPLVEVAPLAAAPVEVGVTEPSMAGALAVTPALLSGITADTLRIGGATVDGGLLVTAGGIAIGGPVAFGGTLDLRATGGVTQEPGAALVVGRLQGDVGGALTLDEFANVFGELGDLSAFGDIFLVSARDLILPPGRSLSAGGELRLFGFGDRIRIDGTATGRSVDMLASGLLAVTGNSIIATGGPIFLSGAQVTLDGTLIATGGEIFIGAGDSATLAGSVFASGGLIVSAPLVGFGGLSAGSTDVTLRLSDSGFASGLLAARSLLVSGGTGADMTGTVAGIGGRPAAARVLRAPPGETTPYGDPPPDAAEFLFNGCEMGVAACGATPDLPRPEDPDLPAEPPARLRPPALALVFQPPRDPSEEEEQAAPDVRAGDF